MSSFSEDVTVLRRLLRSAFSDILNLKTRLTELESQTQKTENNNPVKGTLALSITPNGNRVEHPLCQLGLKFSVTKKIGTKLEFTSDSPGKPTQLTKVVHKANLLGGSLKLTYAPCGGCGDDVVPTLNPNAEQGLSQFVSKGCTIHQSCRGEAFGIDAGSRKGNRIAGGLFLEDTGNSEAMLGRMLAGMILAPTRDLTFGLVGCCPIQGLSNSTSSGSSKIGAIGALDLSGEALMTGWLCAERTSRCAFGWESCGIVLSSPHMQDTTCRRLGFASSKIRGAWKHTFEFSASLPALNGSDVLAGLTATVESGHVTPYFGIKNVIHF